MATDYPRVISAAENALMIEFNNEISLPIHRQVTQCIAWLQQHPITGVLECVASYRTILVYFDLRKLSAIELEQQLLSQLQQLRQFEQSRQASQTHSIEVCYDESLGADLSAICEQLKISREHFIEIHSGAEYWVYALGFAPGFAYMGDVPEAIRVPRHATPRQKVPAGSVAIANQQTAIYPHVSPGGWQLVGQAVSWPQLAVGDCVRFRPISLARYQQLQEQHQ